MMIINNKRYKERGEELKVLHYASAAATHNRNLRQFAAICGQSMADCRYNTIA
jgi:hypothetical protein